MDPKHASKSSALCSAPHGKRESREHKKRKKAQTGGYIPLLVRPREEGWMRGNEKCREASLFRADGVVNHDANRIPKHFGQSTTPSAPAEEASRNFLDVASTPPHEEGNVLPVCAFCAFCVPASLPIENSRRDGRLPSAPGCAFPYLHDRQYRCNLDHPLPHCSFESPLCIAGPHLSRRNADPFYR